jgi:hypothetical protein
LYEAPSISQVYPSSLNVIVRLVNGLRNISRQCVIARDEFHERNKGKPVAFVKAANSVVTLNFPPLDLARFTSARDVGLFYVARSPNMPNALVGFANDRCGFHRSFGLVTFFAVHSTAGNNSVAPNAFVLLIDASAFMAEYAIDRNRIASHAPHPHESVIHRAAAVKSPRNVAFQQIVLFRCHLL